jgi:hypothetical protein
MLKTISAALLAVSVLAAPAFAANQATRTTHAPVIKAEQVKQLKPGVLNANARMGRHHVRHHRFHHRHFGAVKTHTFAKVTVKHIVPATRRG